MKNPTLARWIKFRQTADGEYIIIDELNNKELPTTPYIVWFARQLNGKTDPYKIDKNRSGADVDELLKKLEDDFVIRDKRFFCKSFFGTILTLWQPRVTERFRLLGFFLNGLLFISWLPLLVFSIFYVFNNLYYLEDSYMILGSLVGLAAGLVLHELGHMFAGLAYGAKIFELGVMCQYVVFPGAYVLMNDKPIKKRMRRIQMYAAGIEMNFLLTALSMILAVRFEALSGFFLGAAIQNAFLGFFNLVFINGLDGMRIIGEVLGVEDIVEKCKNVTKSRIKKRRLNKDGISGKATLMLCYAFRAFQILLPLVFAINIVEVVNWFV